MFICNPIPTKAEWGMVQDLHSKLLLFCVPQRLSAANNKLHAEIIADIMVQDDSERTHAYQNSKVVMMHEKLVAKH